MLFIIKSVINKTHRTLHPQHIPFKALCSVAFSTVAEARILGALCSEAETSTNPEGKAYA